MPKLSGLHVTEDQLRAYVLEYHHAYAAVTQGLFSEDELPLLRRHALLSSGAICYVSTQFGAGFEYLPPPAVGIRTTHSRARIEDMFVRAPAALRNIGPMFSGSASDVTIQDLTLEGAFPFRLGSQDSAIKFIDVRFKAGDWSRDVLWAELYGNRTAAFWSEENAAARARASNDIPVALFQLKEAHKRALSLDRYLTTFKQRHVLVLGDYSGEGLQRLTMISAAIADAGYVPVLLKDLTDPPEMNLIQKAVAVGAVSRFVVIDDSSKSGHLVEWVHLKVNDWIVLVLRLEGSDGSYMTRGASVTSSVIREDAYTLANLAVVLPEAMSWAELRIAELRREFADTYPWRADVSNPGPSGRPKSG